MNRASSKAVWHSKDGEVLIRDMTDGHLANTVKFCVRNASIKLLSMAVQADSLGNVLKDCIVGVVSEDIAEKFTEAVLNNDVYEAFEEFEDLIAEAVYRGIYTPVENVPLFDMPNTEEMIAVEDGYVEFNPPNHGKRIYHETCAALESKLKTLTWDEVADIYGKETGGHARTKPMEEVYDWAVSRKDLFKINEDTTLSLIE